MKINRLLVLALMGVLAVMAMGFFSLRVSAQTAAPDDVEDEGESPDVPITGDALEQASAAALAFVGEGVVTDTEIGDEEGYYEIEITLGDGNQVDVHLDEHFNVLSRVSDEE